MCLQDPRYLPGCLGVKGVFISDDGTPVAEQQVRGCGSKYILETSSQRLRENGGYGPGQ